MIIHWREIRRTIEWSVDAISRRWGSVFEEQSFSLERKSISDKWYEW